MFMNLRGCKIDLTPTLKHDEVTPPLGLPSGRKVTLRRIS